MKTSSSYFCFYLLYLPKPNQPFLLADHIKLSLLERQRAQTLRIDDEAGGANDSQDGHISRSLDQFRDGVKALQAEKGKLEQAGDTTYVHTRIARNDSI